MLHEDVFQLASVELTSDVRDDGLEYPAVHHLFPESRAIFSGEYPRRIEGDGERIVSVFHSSNIDKSRRAVRVVLKATERLIEVEQIGRTGEDSFDLATMILRYPMHQREAFNLTHSESALSGFLFLKGWRQQGLAQDPRS
jgi:hypothetical protein